MMARAVKRLEYVRQHIVGNTRAGIGDQQLLMRAIAEECDLQFPLARRLNRMQRIPEQIV
jgi:hypothetical protein